MMPLIKRFFILTGLLSVLLIPLPLSAQTVLLEPAEYYLGVSGSATASMYNFSPRITQGFHMGYGGGIAFRYITEKHFGLQLEANYNKKGWVETNHAYSRSLDYIEFPFLTHLYFGNINRFTFQLGPQVSYLLEEKALIGEDLSNSEEPQHSDPIHFNFDYGIAAGFGYNLHLKKGGDYQLELRAYYGLSDIFPNQRIDYFSNSNPMTLSVRTSWFFRLNKDKK